jgi:hypothetical protein
MAIVSHPPNAAYRTGWDVAFGKKEKQQPREVCGETYCSDGNAGGHSGAEFSACGRPRGHNGPRGDVPDTKCGRGPE